MIAHRNIQYVPKYEVGQFDDAPEGDDSESIISCIKNNFETIKLDQNHEIIRNPENNEFEDGEEEEDFDNYLEDELNYNEEWNEASGGISSFKLFKSLSNIIHNLWCYGSLITNSYRFH